MPQQYNPGTGQDWGAVNVGRGGVTKPGGAVKTSSALRIAQMTGQLATEKRHGAGGNKSAHSQTALGISAKKLEEADDVGTIAKVDKSLSKAIMQARTAKKMTQKELATAINEKPQVVAEYESGKAIPNAQIISKLERKLGVKLPRPGQKSSVAKPAGGGAAGAKKAAPGTMGGLVRGGPPKRK